MRVTVVVESRFVATPDGAVFTFDPFDHRYFATYLSAFSAVRVVARVKPVPALDRPANRVDGPDVEVTGVPFYHGSLECARRLPAIRRTIREVADSGRGDAVILRVPSFAGSLLAAARERQGLPYCLEVMGDPYEAFAPGGIRHPLRPLLRRRITSRLRYLCRSALGVSYVTQWSLQSRYPAGPDAVVGAYSDVLLPPEAYVPRPRPARPAGGEVTLVSVGTLEVLTKGVDTLLAAVARLAGAGLPVRLVHLGDGRFRPWTERVAERLGVADRVRFVGRLTAGEAVRRELDAADIFVMPSRTEGLPKALVEAMARALPAVASNVGGIPELLPAECLVGPGEPGELAERIARMAADPARLAAASAANLERARDFSVEALIPRAGAFYRAVRDATAGQLRQRNPVPSGG